MRNQSGTGHWLRLAKLAMLHPALADDMRASHVIRAALDCVPGISIAATHHKSYNMIARPTRIANAFHRSVTNEVRL